MTFDELRALDFPRLIEAMQAHRRDGHSDDYWLLAGLYVGKMMENAGYSVSLTPSWPPSRTDTTRIALDAEIQAGKAAFPDRQPDDAHLTLHHFLVPAS